MIFGDVCGGALRAGLVIGITIGLALGALSIGLVWVFEHIAVSWVR